ncbi:MAG: pilus assembly protein [Actinobacteria bacterium]|nr:pilus assembly protein [Actinomycetota bacterium]MCL5072058.1 pilus assembly protein [Actinomycetota bacterium]
MKINLIKAIKLKKLKNINYLNGQASLEFILVIPILILVIMIVSQLGYLVYYQNVLEQSAREGARIVSTTNSDSLAYQRVMKICSNLDSSRLKVDINSSGGSSRNVGDIVTVNLTYNYSGIFKLINLVMGDDIFIKSSSSAMMECY